MLKEHSKKETGRYNITFEYLDNVVSRNISNPLPSELKPYIEPLSYMKENIGKGIYDTSKDFWDKKYMDDNNIGKTFRWFVLNPSLMNKYKKNSELGKKIIQHPNLLITSINLFFILNLARFIGIIKALKFNLNGKNNHIRNINEKSQYEY